MGWCVREKGEIVLVLRFSGCLLGVKKAVGDGRPAQPLPMQNKQPETGKTVFSGCLMPFIANIVYAPFSIT
jgi:hypothetical protein